MLFQNQKMKWEKKEVNEKKRTKKEKHTFPNHHMRFPLPLLLSPIEIGCDGLDMVGEGATRKKTEKDGKE